ncbi:MAG: M12 family metallo-peptidase [Planctomycetota bacterium]|nr:M12 family metallo-peptidase [Planctomycetota bacterium]
MKNWLSKACRAAMVIAAGAAVAVGTTAHAQHRVHPDPISIKDMPVADLAGGVVVWLDVPANTREAMTITLPTEHRKELVLAIEPNSILDETHEVRAYFGRGPNDYHVVDCGPETTYTGVVQNLEDSRVGLSIIDDGIIGGIYLPDGSTVWVQPLSDFLPGAPAEMHVVYEGEDSSCGGICGVANAPNREGHDHETNGYDPRGACGGTYCEALVACDADFAYYQDRGSSTTATRDRITAIINVMNHQYQRDVQITHAVGTILVRTTSGSDPYTSNNNNTLLSQFRSEWNAVNGAILRDVAHLFTGREIDGNIIGTAYVGQVCDLPNAYGFSQSDFSSSFSCVTDLTAHEVGHNWDANHCTCTSSTMNPSITCTNTFQNSTTPNSITDINAYENSVGCLTSRSGIPANNMCTSATRVRFNGNWTGSNVGATTDGGETTCGDEGGGLFDVWWVVTPPVSGTVTLSTCGSSFDTVLSVFDDCPGGVDDLVACNDDIGNTVCPSNGLNSQLTFSAVGGSTYYIRVAGFNGATGSITLNVDCPEPANNSPCSLGAPIFDGNNLIGTVYGAASDGDATCGSSTGNQDVWYEFTAPCPGTLVVSTCGSHDWQGNEDSGMDTVLSLHSACIGDTTNQLACNDDSSTNCTQAGAVRDSRVSTVVTRGQVVQIRVAPFGASNSGFGTGMFRIQADFTQSVEAPEVTAIANQSVNCSTLYTGPTPSVVAPSCMTGVTWSLVTGPAGMTINSATGVVSWPNPVVSTPLVTIRATNSAGFDDEGFILTVDRISPLIVAIPNNTIGCGSAYTGPTPSLTNPGCMNPITSWVLLTGPAGMTINAATGVVSWPTPVAGAHLVNIQAINSVGSDTESWTVTVSQSAPVLTDIPDAAVACGPYTGPTPTFTNPGCMGPATLYQLAAGAPAGMTINAATGVVSWANPVAGVFPITIRVTTAVGTDTESWTLTVNRIAPVIVAIPNGTHNLPNPYVGPTPSLTNAGCMNPVSYSLVTFPAGMTINNATGVVTWAAPVLGVHNITIRATNSAGFDDETWRIEVLPGVPCDPDVNCDGNVDQDDIACLEQAVAGELGCICTDPDFNQDGNVDQDDIDALSQVVAGSPCP